MVFLRPFLRPTGGQRGGDERQKQLVVAGDGVAARFRSAAATLGGGGALHYILHRTVVLDKVKVRSGNGAEGDAEIADDRDGFEEDFGQENGGAPVEIHAARMHLLDERAEKAEVQMRGRAKSSAVSGAMHVRNVGSDGDVDGHRNTVVVGRDEDAGIRMLDWNDAAREELAGGFAVADSSAIRKFGNFVDVLAGFLSHAELAFAEAGFDVFGSVAGKRDFEIVNERGAIHGNPRNEAAFHQIDQDRAEADFDDVAADAPENRFALLARDVDGAEEMAEIFSGENIGKRIEEFGERTFRAGRLCKVADADFALARRKRVSVNCAERKRTDRVDAHCKVVVNLEHQEEFRKLCEPLELPLRPRTRARTWPV